MLPARRPGRSHPQVWWASQGPFLCRSLYSRLCCWWSYSLSTLHSLKSYNCDMKVTGNTATFLIHSTPIFHLFGNTGFIALGLAFPFFERRLFPFQCRSFKVKVQWPHLFNTLSTTVFVRSHVITNLILTTLLFTIQISIDTHFCRGFSLCPTLLIQTA